MILVGYYKRYGHFDGFFYISPLLKLRLLRYSVPLSSDLEMEQVSIISKPFGQPVKHLFQNIPVITVP